MALLAAVDRSLESLGERVTDDHAMHVVGLQTLAGQLDAHPEDEKLWREFRLLLSEFMEAVTTERGDSDAIQSLLDRLAGVRDSADFKP